MGTTKTEVKTDAGKELKMKTHKIEMLILICLGISLFSLTVTGCVMVSSFCMLDTNLIGTWKLVSATVGGQTITCPGSDETTGFECGENELLVLNSNGTYDESIASTVDDSGFWFAVNGRLMMDDEINDNNPVAYTYSISGNILTASTLSGTVVAQYERQSAVSTINPFELVFKNPSMSISMLTDKTLIGTWRYTSITYGTTVVNCPGTSDIPGISCGDNETVTFNFDNTFTETVSNTDHSAGAWYSLHGRLFLDDTVVEDNDPSAWIYSVDGNVLTMTMWGGLYVATLERVEEQP